MATTHRIIYTRHSDGGVTVEEPSTNALRFMQNGGRWDCYDPGFVERQIAAREQDGVRAEYTAKFMRAMQFGGCSEAEAWAIIRDLACLHLGTAHEKVHIDELPDRWFRNAWRRSANGGPIVIDLTKARQQQWERIWHAVSRENKRRALDLFGPAKVRISKNQYASAIKHARDEHELRRIWPHELERAIA